MRCFVLMPFKGFDDIYIHIYKKSCESVGIICDRIDEDIYNRPGFIPSDILEQIESADIIIADISNNNPNVFYELGYAHHLAIDNVIMTKMDDGSNIPFDVSNLRTIFYERKDLTSYEVFKTKLTSSLKGLMNNKSTPLSTVKNFYKNIVNKQYEKAWNFLSAEKKAKRWQNSLDRFIDGYKYTHTINHLHITPLASEQNIVKYSVSYIEEVDAPVIDTFTGIGRRTIKELNKINREINELKVKLENHGFDKKIVDELTLFQLVAPNRNAILSWLLSNNSRKNVEDLFSNSNLTKMHYCFEVYVSKLNNEWHISKFRPVEAD